MRFGAKPAKRAHSLHSNERDACDQNCLIETTADCTAMKRMHVSTIVSVVQLWRHRAIVTMDMRLLCTMPARHPMWRPMLSCIIGRENDLHYAGTASNVQICVVLHNCDHGYRFRHQSSQSADQCCPVQHRPESKTIKGADPTDAPILLLLDSHRIVLL